MTSSTAAPPMRNWRGVAMLCAQRRRMEHLMARIPVSTACSARGVPREDWLPAIVIVFVFFFVGFWRDCLSPKACLDTGLAVGVG